MPENLTSSYSTSGALAVATAAGASATGFFISSRTSFSTILPLGPVGVASAALTPALVASSLALGEIFVIPSLLTVAAAGAAAGASATGAAAGAGAASAAGAAAGSAPSGRREDVSSPFVPIAHTFTSTGTSSPFSKNISRSSPSSVDSHSNAALSVS